MATPKIFKMRYLAVIILALVLSATAYAFAAQNTVEISGAGDGVGDISGYDIVDVDYTLNPANPTLLSQVEFDLTAQTVNSSTPGTPNTVYIKFNTDATWFSCDGSNSNATWTCDLSTGSVDVEGQTELQVVAAE